MSYLKLFLMVGVAGAVASSAPCHADKADRDKPINVSADTSTLDDAQKITTLNGNVIITQGTLTIHAKQVVMRQLPDGTQTATATGNPVEMRQKRDGSNEYVEGYAARVEYNEGSDLVQLFDNALLRRGKDELRNNYIVYNTSTEFAEAKCPPGKENTAQCGRVHITLQPAPKPAASPAAPAAATPSPPGADLKPATELKTPPSE